MNLRPYQHAAHDAVMSAWEESQRTLVVMPTGLGKTILFASLIKDRPGRSLVIAHREELIFQAVDKVRRVTGFDVGVEMGNMRVLNGMLPNVVVATVQTLSSGGDGGGRLSKFMPDDFDTLVIDEAHHSPSVSYRKVLDYFTHNKDLRVLGVTATPDRADEEALGQVFESVAYDYEILDAIHEGWLVPIEQQMIEVGGLDYSQIRTTAGDLNGSDLARVMEAETNLHSIASPSVDIIGDRRAIVFAASVEQSRMLCEIFNRHRPNMAGWVCGNTPKDERRQLLDWFSKGKVQVVVNCGVLTEGFDDPGVEVIVMGRPTKSRSLYAQMIGRATRPLPGIVDGPETAEMRRAAIEWSEKPSCLVIDFVGNSGRHKLVTSADILGGKVSDEAIAFAVNEARRIGRPVRMDKMLDEQQELLNQQARERELEEAARRARLRVGAQWKAQTVSPFEVFDMAPQTERGWHRGKHLSERQAALLAKHGINPENLPYHQAKQLLEEMFRRWNGNLCSFKQAKVLKRFGYKTDVTFQEASAIIDRLAKNGWRKPAEVAA